MPPVYKRISIIIFPLFVFCFCKKDDSVEKRPSACFQTNERMYGSGETVFFQNCSENYDRVEWNFGNGQTSTLVNPTFSWQEKGRHEVSLQVFKNGLSSVVSRRVTIADSTYAGFRADFSNWEGGYGDSLIKFSVYSILADRADTAYSQTVKAGSLLFIDPPVKGPGDDINSEFMIRLVLETQGGIKDSLTTGPFILAESVNNFTVFRTRLKFVTVDHIYTLICK